MLSNYAMDEIPEISLEGFQVIHGDIFRGRQRSSYPAATLKFNSISFNRAALSALHNCERIRFEINPQTKAMVIIPVTAKDVDNVSWTKNGKEPTPRKIECIGFASYLFELWKWNKEFTYRSTGKVVTADKKVMLLFEFSNPEKWKSNEKAKSK